MKTGSTALARGLTELARSYSLPDGLLYPIDKMWEPRFSGEHIQKHHLLGAASRVEALKEREDLRALLSSIVLHIRENRSRPPENTVIFVWEGCAHRFVVNPESVGIFLEFMKEFFDDIDFTFNLRDQKFALPSLAQQIVRGNRPTRRNKDLMWRPPHIRLPSHWANPYDYRLLWQSLENHALIEKTWFRVYEESEKKEPYVLADLFVRLGFPGVDISRSRLGSEPIHQATTCGQFLLLLAFSRLLSRNFPGNFIIRPLKMRLSNYARSKRKRTPLHKATLCRPHPDDLRKTEDYYSESNQFIAGKISPLTDRSWLARYQN